jgi:hypothetical protein
MTLQEEAKELYPTSSGMFNDNLGQYSRREAFEAGANSVYVQAEKLKFAIEQLESMLTIFDKEIEYEANHSYECSISGDIEGIETCKRRDGVWRMSRSKVVSKLEELKQQLKEIEDE